MRLFGEYLRTRAGRAVIAAIMLTLFAGATALTGCNGSFAPTHAIVTAERTTSGVTIRATLRDTVNGYHFALPPIPVRIAGLALDSASVGDAITDTVALDGLDSAGIDSAVTGAAQDAVSSILESELARGAVAYFTAGADVIAAGAIAADAMQEPGITQTSPRTYRFAYEAERARRAWHLPPIQPAPRRAF